MRLRLEMSLAMLVAGLMRNDPPWAPFAHTRTRLLVSPSLGCFRHHPINAVDITALCKKQ